MTPRVVVTHDPENSEFPFESLDAWITPIDEFYVRNHFPVPAIDPEEWRLRVGPDGTPRELTLDDLETLPARTVVATLECAGNGRKFNDPPVEGVQWGTGAVSNGEWSGPSLADVLEAAGVAPMAHVHLTGADRGTPRGAGEEIRYRRSLPRSKATDPDTLVALRLNGEPLPAEHGAPARVVAPGWYGMASVKWLVALEPAPEPSRDHFMAADYTRRRPDGAREPLDWIQPKAEIARPSDGGELTAGRHAILGAGWSGAAPLDRVELTADGGRTWSPAELDGPATRYGWRLWRWEWLARPGVHRLAARATDAEGRTQPPAPDPAAPGYQNHWVRFRTVTVV